MAVKNVYGDEIPAIYQLKNCALEKVEGTDKTYAEYVAAHSKEWTNIMTTWASTGQTQVRRPRNPIGTMSTGL